MSNLNTSWQNYVHLILNISVKELYNFIRKHSSTVELLISAVTGPEVTVWTGQRSWDRATVNPWNTRLHRSSSLACQQSWPQSSRLPDLGEAAGACVLQPEFWRRPAEVAFAWRVEPFQPDDQLVIDEAVRQWRSRLQACIRARGWYFEHRLQTCLTFALDSHMSKRCQ